MCFQPLIRIRFDKFVNENKIFKHSRTKVRDTANVVTTSITFFIQTVRVNNGNETHQQH